MTTSRFSIASVAFAAMCLCASAQANNSMTTLTPYGFVQLNATYEKSPANGSVAYSNLAKQIDDTNPSGGFFATARASRLGLKGNLMGDNQRYVIEADFGGTPASGTTGGKTPAATSFQLRHAYLESGPWLAGQTWTNVYDTQSAPETIDSGAPQTSSGIRQAQVRYQLLNNNMTMASVSLETPTGLITTSTTKVDNVTTEKSSLNNGRVNRPDLTFKITHNPNWGSLTFAGVKNQYVYDTTTTSQAKDGYLLVLSSAIPTSSGKLVGGITQGNGAGRYQWGSYAQGAVIHNGSILTFNSKGQWLGYQHKLNESVRINAHYSQLTFEDTPPLTDGSALQNKRLRQFMINSFVKVSPGVELGAEWVKGQRQLLSQQINHENRFNVQMRATF